MPLDHLIIPLIYVIEFLWALTFILIIRRSYLDKACGMPMLALCFNFSWEIIFSGILPYPYPHDLIFKIWGVLDLIIMYQLLIYWPRFWPKEKPKPLFYIQFLTCFALSFSLIWFITKLFNDPFGLYTAFGQCLLMSVLFIWMLRKRNSIDGQSLYIALCKWIATAICTFNYMLYHPHAHFTHFLGYCVFIADFVYVKLIYKKCKELMINPWTRV